jgi:CheY-like chemotaxis protein
MDDPFEHAVLAAEADVNQTWHLVRCLVPLGLRVYPASSVREVIDRLRKQVFTQAFVATELNLDGEPLINRIGQLPSIQVLVALGPGGNTGLESRARAAGAGIYLTRPVTTEMLAEALQLTVPNGRLA